MRLFQLSDVQESPTRSCNNPCCRAAPEGRLQTLRWNLQTSATSANVSSQRPATFNSRRVSRNTVSHRPNLIDSDLARIEYNAMRQKWASAYNKAYTKLQTTATSTNSPAQRPNTCENRYLPPTVQSCQDGITSESVVTEGSSPSSHPVTCLSSGQATTMPSASPCNGDEIQNNLHDFDEIIRIM